MCDLADSLIGKANQIEVSCHISFFSEFKKQKSQHSLAITIARAAGSKLSPLHFPLRRTPCVLWIWASHHMEAFSTVGEALLRAHKYHHAKSCQDLLCDIERIGFNLNASRERLGDGSRSRTHSG